MNNAAETTSYITANIVRLKRFHYIINPEKTDAIWFNFYKGPLDEYIRKYGGDFCLVINHSKINNDAFILPYKDFKDLFSIENLSDEKRWHGYIHQWEVIRLTPAHQGHEKFAGNYHNRFDLLLPNAPKPLPKEPKDFV